MSTFQRLYDSEINFPIVCFWDGGFVVKLGDDLARESTLDPVHQDEDDDDD